MHVYTYAMLYQLQHVCCMYRVILYQYSSELLRIFFKKKNKSLARPNQIWCELRHLSLAELAVVISCVVSGNALPDFLLNPNDYACGPDTDSSCGGGGAGFGGNSRIFSRSSRGTPGLESVGTGGFLSEYLRGMCACGGVGVCRCDG